MKPTVVVVHPPPQFPPAVRITKKPVRALKHEGSDQAADDGDDDGQNHQKARKGIETDATLRAGRPVAQVRITKKPVRALKRLALVTAFINALAWSGQNHQKARKGIETYFQLVVKPACGNVRSESPKSP